MACCPNGNECNQVVTIGYLKSFVGSLIQNSAGQTVSVNYSDNTYCPTRAELTSGSIIPNHSKGSTPNGDTDGIVVGGSGSNIHVTQSELSLVYTRFKSFSIGASPTTISECGGSSTLSFSHKYTRTTVSMNGSCVTGSSSTEVSDTAANEVSWNSSSFGSVSYPTFSVGKNGSVSAASRSTTVTGTVRFRGTNHSDSVSITQNALTGGYTHYVSSYTVATGVSARATTSTSFGCAGGSYGAEGTGYYDSYNVYSWDDSCGTNYPSLTTDVYAGAGSTSLGTKSGSFGSLTALCNTNQYDSDSFTFSYGGRTSSPVSFSQSCPKDPSKCADCRDHTEWEDYDCSAHPGETITINGTAYTNCKANDTGGCDCTETPVTDEIPCPNCEDYVEWESYDCSQHPGETITVNGTAYTCTPDSSGGCDCTETPTAKTVSCSGGCGCGDFGIDTSSLTWEYNDTGDKTINITKSGSCISVTNVSVDNTHFSASRNGSTISVHPRSTTSSSEETGTLTISYTANGSTCTPGETVSLTHKPSACTQTSCVCYLVSDATASTVPATATNATVTWNYSAITWTTASNCTTTSALTSTGRESSGVTFAPATCSDYSKNGIIDWAGHTACTSNGCGSSNAKVSWTVNQTKPSGCDCDCSKLKVSTTSVSVNVGGSTSVSYTANCVNISSIDASNSNITINTGSTGTIRITGETSGTSTITITGSADGTTCTEVISVSVGCPTITISPDNGSTSCDGGTVTFTHS